MKNESKDSITVVIPRRGINDEGRGKKHALFRLISAATTDYVWMQDDDVVPPQDAPPQDADLIILPLRMQSLSKSPSLLERLQIAEYAGLQQLTIETAMRSRAVLCSGANLIVRRERWLESYADLHPDIPSGDDMFLLESFKRRGLSVRAVADDRYAAIVRPLTSWSAFFRQRMRWAGKAPHYTDRDILLCGAIVLIMNILQICCPIILVVKFPIEYRLIKKRDPQVPLWLALLLEVLYPLYLLICLVGGFFRRQW